MQCMRSMGGRHEGRASSARSVDATGKHPYDDPISLGCRLVTRGKELRMAPSSTSQTQEQRVQEFVNDFRALREEVGKVIVGHDDVISHVLTGLFAGGHVLLEGVPGLGKTLLIKTLAKIGPRWICPSRGSSSPPTSCPATSWAPT